MSQEAVHSEAVDVTGSDVVITDAQVDKFFESNGENLPSQEEIESKEIEDTQKEEKPVEKVEKNVEKEREEDKKAKEEQNYKGMAAEERAKRKELQERVDRMEQTFQQLVQRANTPPPPQIPSYDENPLDYLRIKQEQIERFIAQQNEAFQQQQQQTQIQQSQQQFFTEYQRGLDQYKSNNKNADAAFAFLREAKIKELEAIGVRDQNEITRRLGQEEHYVIQQAARENASPFDLLYSAAVARGFQPGADNQFNQSPIANQESNNRISQLQKGAQVSRSLNNAKSIASSSSVTLDQLSKMNADDLDEFIKNDENWKRLARIMP